MTSPTNNTLRPRDGSIWWRRFTVTAFPPTSTKLLSRNLLDDGEVPVAFDFGRYRIVRDDKGTWTIEARIPAQQGKLLSQDDFNRWADEWRFTSTQRRAQPQPRGKDQRSRALQERQDGHHAHRAERAGIPAGARRQLNALPLRRRSRAVACSTRASSQEVKQPRRAGTARGRNHAPRPGTAPGGPARGDGDRAQPQSALAHTARSRRAHRGRTVRTIERRGKYLLIDCGTAG